MRTLLLMRHAKSDWGAPALSDFDRPLNARGERDAPRMGRWMRQRGLQPGGVIYSPALRVRQTLAGLRRHVEIDESVVQSDKRLYLAPLATLLTVVAESPAGRDPLLLMGHNPGVEDLLIYLCGADLPRTKKGKLMTTASVAQISLPDDWQSLAPESGRLQCLMRPKALER